MVSVPSKTDARAQRLLRSILAVDSWFFFLVVVLALTVQTAYWSTHVLTDQVYYQTFAGQLSTDEIGRLLRLRREYAWLSYAFIPLSVIVQIGFTSLCLLVGAVLAEYQLPFAKAFKIALVSEVVLVAEAYAKTAWMAATHVQTVADAASFTPLSLLSLMGSEHVTIWMAYPLQVANAFELFYWIVLALCLRTALQRPFGAMMKFVAGSYGLGLVVYVVTVVFITVNIGRLAAR